MLSKIENSIPLYHIELVRDKSITYNKYNVVEDAAQIFHQVLDRSPVEQFMVIYMDSRNIMVGAEKIAMGQLDRVHVSMRDMFRGAISASVPRLILGHNHPNCDPTPSPEDMNLTLLAVEAGYILGIEIWDHIIVSPDNTHTSIFDSSKKAYEEKLLGAYPELYKLSNVNTTIPFSPINGFKPLKSLL